MQKPVIFKQEEWEYMKTEIRIDKKKTKELSPLIFGNFIEHIEDCIQGGIFDKGSSLSNEKGIRLDVLEKCKELSPTVVRFPGGTVMGIYHWEEHVGPVESRKKKRNIVWGGMLCHEFGTCEFIDYCRELGAEPMICVNMPTGTPEEAANWVEYCNGTGDTYYANLRRSHGYEEPFNVKYWCIGNESYAEPDLGIQHDVNVYIRDAWEFTKYMKMTDPSVKLVYVGFDDEWNKAVLDSFSPVCDYLSLHFYANTTGGADAPFEMLEDFIKTLLKPCAKMIEDYNQKDVSLNQWYRIPPRSGDIRIAVDEWNIWNVGNTGRSKYGVIQTYTWNDALWVACFLNTLISNCDVIGAANMAQMVNVIAPIMAEKEGSYRQTTFYPMMLYRRMAGDRAIDCECEILEVSATEKEGKIQIFAVNRNEEPVETVLPMENGRLTEVTCPDKMLENSLNTDNVKVSTRDVSGGKVRLQPNSINVIDLG